MFLFYGTYMFRGKPTPIVHAIRKSVVSGRHRFTLSKNVSAYEILTTSMAEHPEWEALLDDLGAAKAPLEFNVMIEKLFRQVAIDNAFALGSKSLASRDNWVDPALDWRKREVSCIRTGVSCSRTGVLYFRTGVLYIRTGVMCYRTGVVCYRTGACPIQFVSYFNPNPKTC